MGDLGNQSSPWDLFAFQRVAVLPTCSAERPWEQLLIQSAVVEHLAQRPRELDVESTY